MRATDKQGIRQVNRQFQPLITALGSRPLTFVMVFMVVGIIGSVLMFQSKAGTPAVSLEAEKGTITSGVTAVGPGSTSSGGAIRFNSNQSSGGSTSSTYTDANPPWALKAGETVDDNRPSGVQVISYDSYSKSGTLSFGQTLAAIRSAATAPYYVRMSAGTYYINDFSFAAGAGTGRGYQDVNSTKYFGGLIGAGADKTFVVLKPNVMTQQQLDGVSAGNPNPVAMYVMYLGGGGLTIPTFISGITFRGNFQQTIPLSGLSGTAPAPYAGLHLVSLKAGSVVQYSRFQGFGFAAKASPPYELGAVESTRSSWTFRRSEIDGRLAKEVNGNQPVASGGLMWNYETDVKAVDSWLHHTRRSGWATHDHATSEGGNANDPGIYYGENFQVEHIAEVSDSFAGSGLGFNSSNVEEVRQTFTYVRPRFTVTSGTHIFLGYSKGNSMAKSISVTDPIIGNTAYNGCLVVGISKVPNSAGNNPYYDLYLTSGLSALPITVTKSGTKLQPILNTAFNASMHTPSKYYIVQFK